MASQYLTSCSSFLLTFLQICFLAVAGMRINRLLRDTVKVGGDTLIYIGIDIIAVSLPVVAEKRVRSQDGLKPI